MSLCLWGWIRGRVSRQMRRREYTCTNLNEPDMYRSEESILFWGENGDYWRKETLFNALFIPYLISRESKIMHFIGRESQLECISSLSQSECFHNGLDTSGGLLRSLRDWTCGVCETELRHFCRVGQSVNISMWLNASECAPRPVYPRHVEILGIPGGIPGGGGVYVREARARRWGSCACVRLPSMILCKTVCPLNYLFRQIDIIWTYYTLLSLSTAFTSTYNYPDVQRGRAFWTTIFVHEWHSGGVLVNNIQLNKQKRRCYQAFNGVMSYGYVCCNGLHQVPCMIAFRVTVMHE